MFMQPNVIGNKYHGILPPFFCISAVTELECFSFFVKYFAKVVCEIITFHNFGIGKHIQTTIIIIMKKFVLFFFVLCSTLNMFAQVKEGSAPLSSKNASTTLTDKIKNTKIGDKLNLI